jgi:flagellar FliL protein
MAKEKDSEKDEGKSKRKLSLSTILIVVLLLVVVGGGAYFFLGRGSAPEAGAAAEAAPLPAAAAVPMAEPVPLGVVIRLDPIFINLKSERFLKLGLALQTNQETEGEGEFDGALALDAAIEIFGNQEVERLSSMEVRTQLKEELLERIVAGYGPMITNVYFTEFVMQ